MSLAEKYRDFDILVEICEESHDQDKLQHYMTIFSKEVTSSTICLTCVSALFKWGYLDNLDSWKKLITSY